MPQPADPLAPVSRARSGRAAIVACARWEAQYITEWLAYHQAIGFDHVFLTCNDDDPAPLWEAVLPFATGPAPFITFSHFPWPGQRFHMHMHALHRHRTDHEWLMLLDVDEFLHLPGCHDVQRFLDSAAPDWDAIHFPRAGFGHGGFTQRPPGGVLRSHVRRQTGLSGVTRALLRAARIDPDRQTQPAPIWTRPDGLLRPGARQVDALGATLEGAAAMKERLADPAATETLRGRGVVHHYPFRSEQDFLLRVARGVSGDFAGQALWGELYESGRHRTVLAELNAVEDRSLAAFWAARLTSEAARRSIVATPGLPNLARGRPARQSSVSRWSSAPDPARDAAGLVNGAITGSYQCHTAHEASPWWLVDLGEAARLHEIRVFNRCDSSALAARASGIELQASADGSHWLTLSRRTEAEPFGGADGNPLVVRLNPPVPGRQVRLVLPGTTNLHLDQVEVYGEAG